MKQFVRIPLLLIFLSVHSYGQNTTIDELQTELTTTQEIEKKVKLLTDIGVEYYNGQVYFDSAATTQVRNEVIKDMQEALGANYGNPSSTHAFGRTSKTII